MTYAELPATAGRVSEILVMCAYSGYRAVLENKGMTSIKQKRVHSIPDGIGKTEITCSFTCSIQ
jgi:hypothetical protein